MIFCSKRMELFYCDIKCAKATLAHVFNGKSLQVVYDDNAGQKVAGRIQCVEALFEVF
jgi:hypothetical protein